MQVTVIMEAHLTVLKVTLAVAWIHWYVSLYTNSVIIFPEA